MHHTNMHGTYVALEHGHFIHGTMYMHIPLTVTYMLYDTWNTYVTVNMFGRCVCFSGIV